MSIITKLNNIQRRAISKAKKGLKDNNKVMLHMATGTGKTETAIKLIKQMNHQNTSFGDKIKHILTNMTDEEIIFHYKMDTYCGRIGPHNMWYEDMVARGLLKSEENEN